MYVCMFDCSYIQYLSSKLWLLPNRPSSPLVHLEEFTRNETVELPQMAATPHNGHISVTSRDKKPIHLLLLKPPNNPLYTMATQFCLEVAVVTN